MASMSINKTRGGQDHECDGMKAAADVVSTGLQWIDKGFELAKVSEEVRQLREAICKGCDDVIPADFRCAHCCCPMEFKITLKYDPIKTAEKMKKTLIVCPLGKW